MRKNRPKNKEDDQRRCMPSFRDGSFGFVGRRENSLARFLVSIWHLGRHNSNERLRRKAEGKTKQLNEAWETFQTAPRSNAKPNASREPNWGDLRERFRREQEKRQARDKKERKRAESNENQERKNLQQKAMLLSSLQSDFFGVSYYVPLLRSLAHCLLLQHFTYTYETQAQ